MLESSFLGLSGPSLLDPLELARPILSNEEIGLEIFALGEVDPIFRKPLEEFRKVCQGNSALGIARSRLHLSYPLLFMSREDWALRLAKLEKMGWPVSGGLFATPAKKPKEVGTQKVPNNLVNLMEMLRKKAERLYDKGSTFKNGGSLQSAIHYFRESARLYSKLVSFYTEADRVEEVKSAMNNYAEALEEVGDCINRTLRCAGSHWKDILKRRDATSFDELSRSALEVRTIFGQVLGIYELAQAPQGVLTRVQRKALHAARLFQEMQRSLEQAMAPSYR